MSDIEIYCFQCEDALSIYREIKSHGIQTPTRPFVGDRLWVVPVTDDPMGTAWMNSQSSIQYIPDSESVHGALQAQSAQVTLPRTLALQMPYAHLPKRGD